MGIDFITDFSPDVLTSSFAVFFFGVCGGLFFGFLGWALSSVFEIFSTIIKK